MERLKDIQKAAKNVGEALRKDTCNRCGKPQAVLVLQEDLKKKGQRAICEAQANMCHCTKEQIDKDKELTRWFFKITGGRK